MTTLQLIEGEVLPASRGGFARRPALGSARGVRRELAATYLELRRGEITEDHARTAAFILRCCLESLRIDEIEQRLTAIEKGTQP